MALSQNTKFCIVGGVSTGKSTFLNGAFCEKLTQCKIKRTTMVPTCYIENDKATDSIEYIYKTISEKKSKFAEPDKKTKYGFSSKYQDFASELVPAKDDRLEKAKIFFELAAKQGNAEAQCQLGIMYSHGEGTTQNNEKAVHYLRLACSQGNPKAISIPKSLQGI